MLGGEDFVVGGDETDVAFCDGEKIAEGGAVELMLGAVAEKLGVDDFFGGI